MTRRRAAWSKHFDGVYSAREICSVCGARFERGAGAWTGPVVIAYVVGAVAAMATGGILYWAAGLFPGFTPVLIAAACAAALLAYRPAKAWWIWLLWATGMVFPDDRRSSGHSRSS